MTYTVGLDVGTQGTKGLLLQADTGKVVSRAHSNYDLLPGLPNGAAEQHPHTWRDAAAEVLLQLLQESRIAPEAIVAVGVSGQQHGSVFLDGRQQVVRPAKLWCDTSTADEAAQLSEAFGRNVPTGFTASKLLWLARHEPDHWARTSQVLLPHDY
ncbi:MAG: xylulokinase, partial [Candidatus Paceibacteria bacterium]